MFYRSAKLDRRRVRPASILLQGTSVGAALLVHVEAHEQAFTNLLELGVAAQAERITHLEKMREHVEHIADTTECEKDDSRNSKYSQGVYEWAERNIRAALAASPSIQTPEEQ